MNQETVQVGPVASVSVYQGSKASLGFLEKMADVKRLMDIHTELGGTEKGQRVGLEPLNRSGIVLLTAVWEGYCEDLASEAVSHLVDHVNDPSGLPLDLRKLVAKEVKEDLHELAVWKLAQDGWRDLLRNRLNTLGIRRAQEWNTPKSRQVDALFEAAIGLPTLSKCWYWKNMTVVRASDKLDGYVSLRGNIAHGQGALVLVKKAQLRDYKKHVSELVKKSDRRVNGYLKSETGVQLFG